MTLPLDRMRLSRLLAMISSAHDGEALNAARLADRMVREAGTDWHALLTSSAPVSPPSARREGIETPDGETIYPPHGDTWLETVRWLAEQHAGRTPEERATIHDWLRTLSAQPDLGARLTPMVAYWITRVHGHAAQPNG